MAYTFAIHPTSFDVSLCNRAPTAQLSASLHHSQPRMQALCTYWMQPLGPHRLPPGVGHGLSYLSPTTLLVMLWHIPPKFIARVVLLVLQVLLIPQDPPSSCSGRANAVTSACTRHARPPIGRSSCTCCQGCGL